MDLTTLVVDFVILLLIVAVAVAFVRAWRMRPARLAALPPEARSRYASSWDRIEKHFIDAPEEAVQQADALTTAMLGESGHPLAGDRLPGRMLAARRKVAEGLRRHRTEDLRLAMLDYRGVFAQMIGPETREPVAEGRRETA